MKYILFVVSTFLTIVSHADELKIITNDGYVGFAPEDHWLLLNIQSKLPVAVAAYQIPNAADMNTQDSTNIIISLIDESTSQGQNALSTIGRPYTLIPPKKEKFKEWQIFTQTAQQGATTYTIVDAVKPVADVVVSVRLAWPHLNNNEKTYDKTMQITFENFLNSIVGDVGKYNPRANETFYRRVK